MPSPKKDYALPRLAEVALGDIAGQRVLFEVICLADMVISGEFAKTYHILGGEG